MKWTTKDGRQLEFSQMTDAHLLNVLRHVIARAKNTYQTIVNKKESVDILDQDYYLLEKYPDWQSLIPDELKREICVEVFERQLEIELDYYTREFVCDYGRRK